MNRNGFTLVELLGVIIILGILSLIVTISVQPVLNSSKNSLSDIQITKIEQAAESYYLQEGINNSFYELDEIRSCVNVSYLSEEGYLDSSVIKNPKDSEEMQGSVKITYKSNNYSFEYQDNTCSDSDLGIICVAVNEATTGSIPEGKYEAGDEYLCEVKPNTKYRFFVLGEDENDSSKVNLIMYSNINKSGIPIDSNQIEDKAGVEWINQEHGILSEDSLTILNTRGPVTTMNHLYNATKGWGYIPNVIVDYIDSKDSDTYGYGGIETKGAKTSIIDKNGNYVKNSDGTQLLYNNLKARLPYKSEIESIIQNLWMKDYLSDDGQFNLGYWLSNSLSSTNIFVYSGYNDGTVFATGTSNSGIGVRPVISIPKELIK